MSTMRVARLRVDQLVEERGAARSRAPRVAIGQSRAQPLACGRIGRGVGHHSILRHVAQSEVPDNLLDRISERDTLEQHYAQVRRRESELLARLLPLTGGDVLSVGAGWDVGRHLFPAPAWRLTVADVDLNVVNHATETGQAAAARRRAGELPFEPGSFDVVLYRLMCFITWRTRNRSVRWSTRPRVCSGRAARWWRSSRASSTR